MTIARFMYDACIPLNVVNSSYYQPMLNATASIGPGYRGPNYHALRVPLLKEAKRKVQMIVDSYHTYWAELGSHISILSRIVEIFNSLKKFMLQLFG